MSTTATNHSNNRMLPAVRRDGDGGLLVPVANWDMTRDWLAATADPATLGGSGVVTGVESAPTTSSHGIPCSDANYVSVWIGDLSSVTSYTVLTYAYCSAADEWVVLTRDNDTQYTWTRGNAKLFKTLSVTHIDRIAVIVTAEVFTEVTRRYRLG